MNKKHNCRDCRFNGGLAPFSGHHISCDVGGKNLFEKARAAALIAKGVIIQLTEKETGNKYPAIEFNPHGVEKGWCVWPLNFDPIWVDKCLFYISTKDDEQSTDRSDGGELQEDPQAVQPGKRGEEGNIPVRGT